MNDVLSLFGSVWDGLQQLVNFIHTVTSSVLPAVSSVLPLPLVSVCLTIFTIIVVCKIIGGGR